MIRIYGYFGRSVYLNFRFGSGNVDIFRYLGSRGSFIKNTYLVEDVRIVLVAGSVRIEFK